MRNNTKAACMMLQIPSDKINNQIKSLQINMLEILPYNTKILAVHKTQIYHSHNN